MIDGHEAGFSELRLPNSKNAAFQIYIWSVES
jgi:hypothetical protein